MSDQAFSTVQFVDPMIGWAVRSASYRPAPEQVVKTEDGGRTWKGQALAADSICALNKNVIWAAGAGEGGITFARSDDGGHSWTDNPIQVPQGVEWNRSMRLSLRRSTPTDSLVAQGHPGLPASPVPALQASVGRDRRVL